MIKSIIIVLLSFFSINLHGYDLVNDKSKSNSTIDFKSNKREFWQQAYSPITNSYLNQKTSKKFNQKKELSSIPNLRGNGMQFTPNKGQLVDSEGNLRPDILFKGDGRGTDVYLRKTGISYVLSNMNDVNYKVNKEIEKLKENGELTPKQDQVKRYEFKQKATIKTHRVDVDFLNVNTSYQIETEQQVEGYNNYYYAHCKEGITHVNSYNLVTHKDLYNNIDVAYYGGKANGLKYDIIVNPGGNPNDIKLKYVGAKSIKLYNNKLQIETSIGVLGEYMPKVYQIIDGKEVNVDAEYLISNYDKAGEATISFKLANYNTNYSLIIDPWITYYGGSSYEFPSSVATDALGNSVTVGTTVSVNFPANAGAGYFVFQNSYTSGGSNGYDVFLVKFNASGTRLFATYVGGSDDDMAYGVTCDAANNIIFTGYSCSPNFPIGFSGINTVHQAFLAGWQNAFLFKMDPTGVRLFSTYYGGSDSDFGIDVCVFGANIYLTGNAGSSNNISTVGAFQVALNGPGGGASNNVFVVRFNSIGVRIWGTYFGGTFVDFPTEITPDLTGNVIICGTTLSTNIPVLSAFQASSNGGSSEAFLFKLSPTGALIWSTYFGTNSVDSGHAVCTDASGNIYLGGYSGAGGLSTPGAFQTANLGGFSDAYIAKFSPSGVRLWCTYLGGNGQDFCSGIACDSGGNIVAAGDTYSAGFPVTSCAYQSTLSGTKAQWLTTIKPNGQQLLCSTLIGSSTWSESYLGSGGTLAIHACHAYIVVLSPCNYPVTAGAWQTTCGGFQDVAIAQLNLLDCNLASTNTVNVSFVANQTTLCPTQSTIFTPSVSAFCTSTNTTYSWFLPGATPSVSALQSPTVTYNTVGSYSVKLVVDYGCGKDSTTQLNYINVVPNPTLAFPAGSFTNDCGSNSGAATVSVSPSGTYTYNWSNGQTTQTATNLAGGIYTVTVTNVSGCSSTQTVSIISVPPFSVLINPTHNTSCLLPNGAASASASSSGTYTYNWSNGQNTSIANGLVPGIHSVTLTNSFGCNTSQTVSITQNTITPNLTIVSPGTLNCSNPSVILTGTSTDPFISYNWQPQNVNTATAIATIVSSYTLNVVSFLTGCTNSSVVAVTQNTVSPNISAGLPSTLTCLNPSIVLNGSSTTSGVTYTWLPQNVSTNSVLVSSAGNYTFSVFDPVNGCSSTSVVVVSQNISLPNIGATSSGSLNCLTTSVVLTGSSTTSGVSYNWQPQNVATNTALVTSGGNYTLTVTNPINSCFSSTVLTVLQNTLLPTGSILTPGGLNCLVNTVTLNANSTGNSSIWNGPGLVNGVNPSVINIPGTYSVTVTNTLNACVSSSVVTVTQNTAAPGVLASVSNTISCNVPSAILTASSSGSGVVYQWINGPSASISSVTLAGTYTVTVTDPINGCVSSTQVTVFAAPSISPSVVVLSQINCFGNNNGALQIGVLSGGNAPFSVTNLNSGSSINNIASFPIVLSSLSAANYSILVSDANGCNQTLFATITQPPALNLALGGNSTLCEGQSTTISSNVSGGSAPYSYIWSPSGGNSSNLTISPNANTTFSLLLTDNNGCQAQASIAIVVNPKPSASLVNNKLTGCSPVCAGFSLSAQQQPGYVYTWQFTNNQSGSVTSSQLYEPDLCFKEVGSYNAGIVISSVLGCSTTLTYNNLIQVYLKPDADFSFSPTSVTMLEPLVSFTNTSSGATNYFWDFGQQNTINTSNQTHPSFSYNQAGSYLVTLIANNGNSCSDTVYKQLIISEEAAIYIPNTFTPNEDNLNDTWGPYGVAISNKDYELSVFDRWGERIFTSNKFESRWDGTYKGLPVKSDVYVYKLKCKMIESSKTLIFAGHVMVER